MFLVLCCVVKGVQTTGGGPDPAAIRPLGDVHKAPWTAFLPVVPPRVRLTLRLEGVSANRFPDLSLLLVQRLDPEGEWHPAPAPEGRPAVTHLLLCL